MPHRALITKKPSKLPLYLCFITGWILVCVALAIQFTNQ